MSGHKAIARKAIDDSRRMASELQDANNVVMIHRPAFYDELRKQADKKEGFGDARGSDWALSCSVMRSYFLARLDGRKAHLTWRRFVPPSHANFHLGRRLRSYGHK